jgi:hypothetical protein
MVMLVTVKGAGAAPSTMRRGTTAANRNLTVS